MTFIQLFVLAVVQGITEFLPISSSGHLVLISPLLGWPDQGLELDVAVHVGTLGAVMLYFHKDVIKLFAGLGKLHRADSDADAQMVLYLALATIPLVLFGLLLALSGMAEYLRDPWVIVTTTIFFGLLLYAVDHVAMTARGMAQMTWRYALLIGLGQALALFPGTSRSGITITVARGLGFNRSDAAKFSMLLSIPAILASGGYIGFQLWREGALTFGGDAMIAAALAFVAGLLGIGILMLLVARTSYTPFVIYRLVLGGFLIWWLL